MNYTRDTEFMNQSQFAKRWGVSRQHISRLCRRGYLPKLGGLVDVVFADLFMKRNGIGLMRIPSDRAEFEQYLKRLEKRKRLVG